MMISLLKKNISLSLKYQKKKKSLETILERIYALYP